VYTDLTRFCARISEKRLSFALAWSVTRRAWIASFWIAITPAWRVYRTIDLRRNESELIATQHRDSRDQAVMTTKSKRHCRIPDISIHLRDRHQTLFSE
jgi:hypothetical protein